MRLRLRPCRHRTTFATGTLLACLLTAPSATWSAPGADTPTETFSAISSLVNSGSARGAADYWTAERIAAATPVEAISALAPPDPGQGPTRTGITQGAPTQTGVETPAPSLPAPPGTTPAPPPGAEPPPPAPTPRDPGATTPGTPTPPPSQQPPTPPGEGPGTARQSDPHSFMGKLFLTMGGQDFVCSATSVTSANRSVIATAGHCVFDKAHGGFASNVTFIPGFNAGKEPLGRFRAAQLFVPQSYQNSGDVSNDLGFATLEPQANGRTLQQVAGSAPIRFSAPRPTEVEVFGYPSAQPFDGTHLMSCTGKPRPDPVSTSDLGIPCDMTQGASGGAWLSDGAVVSVSSFKYRFAPATMWGPVLGDQARAAYLSAATVKVGDEDPTDPGTPSDDPTSEPVSTPQTPVVNGGFEANATGWEADPDVVVTDAPVAQDGSTGKHFAWFNGYGRTSSAALKQVITVPNGPSQLTFRLKVDTDETTKTTVYDTLTLTINDQVVATFSNLDAKGSFITKTVDLSPWAGQRPTLRLDGREGPFAQTSFFVDDVEVRAST